MQQALENIYKDPDKIIKYHVRLETEAYGVSFRQLACKIRDHYNSKLSQRFIYLDEGDSPAAVKSVSGKLAPYFGLVSDKHCRIPLQIMPAVVAALSDENRKHCAAALRKLLTFDDVVTAGSEASERDLCTGLTKELHEAIQRFTVMAFDGLANDSVDDLERLDQELVEAHESIIEARKKVIAEIESRPGRNVRAVK